MSTMLNEAINGTRGPDQQRIAEAGIAWIETILAKNADYGSSVFSVPMLAPECDAGTAIRVRMSDKVNRVMTLLKNAAMVKSESIEDSIKDLGAYCLLWCCRPIEQHGGTIDYRGGEWHSETEVELPPSASLSVSELQAIHNLVKREYPNAWCHNVLADKFRIDADSKDKDNYNFISDECDSRAGAWQSALNRIQQSQVAATNSPATATTELKP